LAESEVTALAKKKRIKKKRAYVMSVESFSLSPKKITASKPYFSSKKKIKRKKPRRH